jgi:peptide chain release factor 1
MGDAVRYREATKRHRDLGKIVAKWRQYERALTSRAESESMTGDADPEIAKMANAELEELALRLPEIERELTLLLLPNDPLDEKNIVMEIRAGTGGDEAALFAGDLFRMYSRYAERLGWKLEILSSNAPDMGGFKEVIFSISGERVYSRLKFESGTHRVQRVPTTEAQGRIHTSAITVAVLPEADEVDMVIKPEDVRIDVYRSSGHGGQSVNTTDSAVRITHLPTGMIVTCQDEKSQLKNRVKAMKVMRSRLLDLEIQKRQDAESAQRREQVGSGDRSGRIRTYNYPQNRVTDHRIGLTLYHLQRVLEGELDDVVGALVADEQKRRLERAGGL